VFYEIRPSRILGSSFAGFSAYDPSHRGKRKPGALYTVYSVGLSLREFSEPTDGRQTIVCGVRCTTSNWISEARSKTSRSSSRSC
jgi:hypothetical protein